MPMDFPDLNSLIEAAKIHKFRMPYKDESEEDYRNALSTHVAPIDYVESCEIRNGVGWDKFNESQNMGMLYRKFLGI